MLLRYMRLADIPQVVAIDKVAFQSPWSARSYTYEVGESTYSHMVVLESPVEQPVQGIKKLLHNIGNGSGTETKEQIIGYGGLWHIIDEAHISTIATHPDWRGKGYGELLLGAMMQRAINLEAAYIVLEVRVSNTVAQNLYHKYGFEKVDVKKRYYRDDGEDAYDMRFHMASEEAMKRFLEHYAATQARHDYQDRYTDTPRPPR